MVRAESGHPRPLPHHQWWDRFGRSAPRTAPFGPTRDSIEAGLGGRPAARPPQKAVLVVPVLSGAGGVVCSDRRRRRRPHVPPPLLLLDRSKGARLTTITRPCSSRQPIHPNRDARRGRWFCWLLPPPAATALLLSALLNSTTSKQQDPDPLFATLASAHRLADWWWRSQKQRPSNGPQK